MRKAEQPLRETAQAGAKTASAQRQPKAGLGSKQPLPEKHQGLGQDSRAVGNHQAGFIGQGRPRWPHAIAGKETTRPTGATKAAHAQTGPPPAKPGSRDARWANSWAKIVSCCGKSKSRPNPVGSTTAGLQPPSTSGAATRSNRRKRQRSRGYPALDFNVDTWAKIVSSSHLRQRRRKNQAATRPTKSRPQDHYRPHRPNRGKEPPQVRLSSLTSLNRTQFDLGRCLNGGFARERPSCSIPQGLRAKLLKPP